MNTSFHRFLYLKFKVFIPPHRENPDTGTVLERGFSGLMILLPHH
ncbi:protein of unassigned function [Methylobacterium oryzae CBMB20]|uniref:Protein of unassigned function n=1 Tax=Methylobacterium oryzae CBMB20 TaxID=693986 RepID=A0A089NRR9_9HYPH|nr:protein of unassigned function [Methylobacterium oryzae CBMB20]